MSGFKCPFCGQVMSETSDTRDVIYLGFNLPASRNSGSVVPNTDQALAIDLHKCPNCKQLTVKYYGFKGPDKGTVINIYPRSISIRYPEYIPEQIRFDYEEACSIVDISPKASATLSRRCLQGMIHDFWGIKEGNLAKEINKLEGKIPPDQWKVIDGVRRLGNIGAHMENDIDRIVDIDPDEAQKLIKLIELLVKNWYIDRYEQQQLYSDILTIDAEKQEQRKPNDSDVS